MSTTTNYPHGSRDRKPDALWMSSDRKVTNLVGGIKAPTVAIPNTIGLPSGIDYSCSGMTEFCGSICYAGKTEKLRAAVANLVMHNWSLLKDATLSQMVALLTDMVAEFQGESDKRNANKIFRIHWDGDFFNGTYTAAWSKVIASFPDIQFWVYTRVATSAVFLNSRKHDNLALYFSADRDNIDIARNLSNKGIRIAYVGKSFADGKELFPSAIACPENSGRLPLIDSKGSACARCGLCVNARRDVLFSSTKK